MLVLNDKGLYCPDGDFYIDPMKKVDTALITHAHSDHARRGSREYYCVTSSRRLLAHRIGQDAKIHCLPYGEKMKFGRIWVSFHPAGHILGSAQIRLENDSKVWVVSGDYKREPDPSCDPFEVVRCDTFVTEATFGNPRYEWGDQSRTCQDIHEWWQQNSAAGRNSILFCYALGKTQRVLAGLDGYTDRPVLLFGEAVPLTNHYRDEGVRMIPTRDLAELRGKDKPKGELIIAPHSILNSPWATDLGDYETAFASGWMKTGAFGARSRYDRGFVLSDHADWPALLRTIRETGAPRVLVQHGGEGALTRELRKLGLSAEPLDPAKRTPDAQRREASTQGELFGSLS